MSSNSLVSIILPTYNREKYISKAINSIIEQEYTNWELLVIDDGSTDNTERIIKSFKDERIKYFYQENSGKPSVARNKGIENSAGEFIAFIDSDDLWTTDKLENQMSWLLNEDLDIDMIFSNAQIMTINNNRRGLWSNLINEYGYITRLELLGKNHIPLPSVVIKKNCLNLVGKFNESDHLVIGEDYDLWLRISDKHKIYFINKPLIIVYKHSANTSTSSPTKNQLYLASEITKRLSEEINKGISSDKNNLYTAAIDHIVRRYIHVRSKEYKAELIRYSSQGIHLDKKQKMLLQTPTNIFFLYLDVKNNILGKMRYFLRNKYLQYLEKKSQRGDLL